MSSKKPMVTGQSQSAVDNKTQGQGQTSYTVFVGGLNFCEDDLRRERPKHDHAEFYYMKSVGARSSKKIYIPLYQRNPSP